MQWIRKELNRSPQLDSVVKHIVLADGIDRPNTEWSPSTHWWSEVGIRGKTAPAEVLVSQFLGGRSSCSRCHDHEDVARSNLARFWGVAAITQGVEVSNLATLSPPAVGFRKEVEPLFYERNDATLVAAIPSLPDGQTLTAPQGNVRQVRSVTQKNLVALYEWMMASDEFAQSHANFVWNSLFGKPLIPRFPLDVSEGVRERQEIAVVLGNQLRASQFDLRKLVVWIAATQAFGLESAPADGNWYLTASDTEIAAYRQRQTVFATFPAVADDSLRSLDQLASWIDASKLSGSDRVGVLASPLPANLSGKNLKLAPEVSPSVAKATRFTDSQVQYLVQASALPVAVQNEIDRMLKSNLAWDSLVDHAFYMTGSIPPTLNDRVAAQRILELSHDKRLALQRIVASRL